MPTVAIDKHIIDGLRKLHIFYDELHSFINYAAGKEIRMRLKNKGYEDEFEYSNFYYPEHDKYICHYCGRECAGLKGLAVHMRRIHISPHKKQIEQQNQNPIKCPYCGKVCGGEHGLQIHIGYKHKDKKEPIPTPKIYFCGFCGYLHHFDSIIGGEHINYKQEKPEKFNNNLFSGKVKYKFQRPEPEPSN